MSTDDMYADPADFIIDEDAAPAPEETPAPEPTVQLSLTPPAPVEAPAEEEAPEPEPEAATEREPEPEAEVAAEPEKFEKQDGPALVNKDGEAYAAEPVAEPEAEAQGDTPSEPTGPTFADLGLPEELLQAITAMGYEVPTPIQEEAIPALMDGRDVVGVAQTGTGKTAAFGLPMLTKIDPEERDVQALVLSPTRELALQNAAAIEDFARRTRHLDVVAVYGGSPYGPQLRALREGAQVVVGTPGRLMDLMERGALDLSKIKMFVLDEADEMLRMGFAEDVETIAQKVPAERLTALFSATMPPQIARVANQHLTDPLRISVDAQSSTVDTIRQTYAVVPYKHKIGALSRVLATREGDAAIVFVRTRLDVEEIALDLQARGMRAAGISGDVAQNERERLVARLRTGALDVLVATDVAARGLDVDRIGLVVNFDVPRENEAYVHRIGRTGRAGREGTSLTFFTPREQFRLRQLERTTGVKMEEVPIPTPAAVSEFKARGVLDSIGKRIEKGRLGLYRELLDEVGDTSGLSEQDIAAALLATLVGDEGPEPRVEKDRRGGGKIRREEQVDENGEFVGASFEKGRDRDGGGGRGGSRGSAARGGRRMPSGAPRYRVEVGHKDNAKPGSIVGAITGEGGLKGSDIGSIDIFPSFSLVEISADMSPSVMGRISKARVAGRALRISPDDGPRGGSGGGSRGGGKPNFKPARKYGRDDHRGDHGFDRDDRRGGSGRDRDRDNEGRRFGSGSRASRHRNG